MARDMDLNVNSKADTRGLDAAERNVNQLRRAADELGDQFRQAARDAEVLDAQLLKTRATTAALAREFSKVDADPALKHQLDASRKAESELKRLRQDIIGDTERNAKAAENAWKRSVNELKKITNDGATESASTFAQVFQGGIIKALANPVGAGIGAGIVIPASIAVAGIAGGVSLGAAGGGAAGAGIAAAAMADPEKVGAAWSQEINKIKAQWYDAGKAFVGPATDAIHIVFGEIADSHLDRVLERAAGYIRPLAEGAAGFARYVIAGVEKLIGGAGPEIEVLREELPQVGEAFEYAAGLIAGGSKGGADGLRDLLNLVEGVIIGTGQFIGYGERAYHALTVWNDEAKDFVHTMREQNGLLWLTLAPAEYAGKVFDQGSDKAAKMAYQFRNAGEGAAVFGDQATVAFYNTAEAADGLNKAIDRLFNETMNLDQANLQAKAGLIELKQTLKENGDTLDANTTKGNANAQAILGQVQRYEQQREAAIAAGNGTKEAADKANAAYSSNVASLRQVLLMLGFTAAEVDNLIGKYAAIPRNISTNINTYYHDYYSSSGSPIGPEERKYGSGGKRAAGGPVMSGLSYLVGESGPEYFTPAQSGVITPTGRMPSVVGSGPKGGSSPGYALPPLSLIEQALATVVMKLWDTGQLQLPAK